MDLAHLFFNILGTYYWYSEVYDVKTGNKSGGIGACSTVDFIHWTNEGISRRNEPYQNEGVTILELDGEKIAFMSDFFKDTEKF